MSSRALDQNQINSARELVNGVIASDGLVYKPFDEETFTAKFITETEIVKKINLIWQDGEKLTGFINGSHKAGTETAYVTFVAVHKEYRRRGIGGSLVKALEEKFLELNPEIKKYEIVFFNPIGLEWIIPGTPGHDHPGTPGIDVSTDAYLFFKNMNYIDFAYQNSFYRLLDGFEWAPDVLDKLEALKEKGITICYYDKEKHGGLSELCDNLGSEDWRNAIFNNVNKPEPYPLLIVQHDGRAYGFTGPLYVQPSGRGYFAGIGVHSEYRGGGAGKALFSALCMGLKEQGARFMTLFTGETNPARNIYRSAGFKIVKTWADMRKEIRRK